MVSRRRRSSFGHGARAANESTGLNPTPLWGMGGPRKPCPKRVTATGEPSWRGGVPPARRPAPPRVGRPGLSIRAALNDERNEPVPRARRPGLRDGLGVVLLVEVVGAVEGLDEVAVDGGLVARGVVGADAGGQTLDRRADAGAVEE